MPIAKTLPNFLQTSVVQEVMLLFSPKFPIEHLSEGRFLEGTRGILGRLGEMSQEQVTYDISKKTKFVLVMIVIKSKFASFCLI